ncbi:MAG: SDR family NAD(P)-dependent oxidoreductase [Thermoleophilia bacterium]
MDVTPLAELIRLDGRAALVTGGAKGIGLGIAVRLAEAGAAVLVADLDEAAAVEAAAGLAARGWRARACRLDVGDEEQVVAAVARCREAFGSLDVLVNNAGIFPNAPIRQLPPETFDRTIATNLRGLYLCTRHAAEAMIAQGRGGAIVNVTSIDALHPSMVGLAHYDASKHGAWGFTKSAALEYAPHGIRVNAVAPGGITTPGVAALSSGASAEQLAAQVEAFAARIPLRRMGDPDEIGRVALVLASDLAAYMTGSQVVVDGGALLA